MKEYILCAAILFIGTPLLCWMWSRMLREARNESYSNGIATGAKIAMDEVNKALRSDWNSDAKCPQFTLGDIKENGGVRKQ